MDNLQASETWMSVGYSQSRSLEQLVNLWEYFMDNSDQEKMSAQSSYNNMQDNVHFPQFPLLASASALRFVYMRHITDASLFHHITINNITAAIFALGQRNQVRLASKSASSQMHVLQPKQFVPFWGHVKYFHFSVHVLKDAWKQTGLD